MPDSAESRLSHAALDVEGRKRKAAKIEQLLPWEEFPREIELLEIGTGSGVIAHYFAENPRLDVHVTAVDVRDERQLSDGFDFRLVSDTRLSFDDDTFDVVITNHVLEHVGSEIDQLSHLVELRRVLKPDGVGYLATPNRWALIEPHFRLVGLSWLPERLRTPYLRFLRRGGRYDCRPVSRSELSSLIGGSGLSAEYLDVGAVRKTADAEGGVVKALVSLIPDGVIALLGPVLPTQVCLLRVAGTLS